MPERTVHEFTPDQIEDTIGTALRAGDVDVVPSLVALLALQDADRAQAVLDTINTGLILASRRDT